MCSPDCSQLESLMMNDLFTSNPYSPTLYKLENMYQYDDIIFGLWIKTIYILLLSVPKVPGLMQMGPKLETGSWSN